MRIRERGPVLSGKKRRDECDVVVYYIFDLYCKNCNCNTCNVNMPLHAAT